MAEADKQNNSSIQSGCTNPEFFDQIQKQTPPEKTIKEINKANSPKGRGKAPSSVRV